MRVWEEGKRRRRRKATIIASDTETRAISERREEGKKERAQGWHGVRLRFLRSRHLVRDPRKKVALSSVRFALSLVLTSHLSLLDGDDEGGGKK